MATVAATVCTTAFVTLLNGTGVAAAIAPAAHAATGATRLERGDPSGGSWGKAEQIPGLAALNKAGSASFNAISCASPGNCAAGGNYFGPSDQQAFVVSESSGAWGKAEQVRGLDAFHQPGKFFAASVIAISCASPGNCAAGGFYYVRAHDQQGFIVTETDGRWGTAQKVPGLQALNTGRYAEIMDMSCTSRGNCAAGGYYSTPVDGFDLSEAFVVNQTHGTWRQAEEVPGTAKLNVGGAAMVDTLSCRPAGNCSAGGSYASGSSTGQAFVVSEVHGHWGQAEEVPGTAELNAGGEAEVNSVSCGSPGNCAAGGDYEGRTGKYFGFEAFVVSEVHGRWGTAEEAPGTAALNKGRDAQVASVSCSSAGNCAAGGQYFSRPGRQQVFVVDQVNGKWRTAEEIPGSGALNTGNFDYLAQVSCGSPGNCAAGGSYSATAGDQAFLVTEVNGTWRTAEEVPGSGTLNNAGFAGTFALSCPAPGHCTAGGYYTYQAPGHTNHQSAFVVSQTKR